MTDEPAAPDETPSAANAAVTNWRWLTFPVFFAFATGLLIASLLNVETDSTLEGVVQIAALLLFGYALAHLIITNVVVAGRVRRRQRAAPGDQAPEDWEDEVVYPDEPPAPP